MGGDCTMMGCDDDGLVIRVVLDQALHPGDYRLVIEHGIKETVCTGRLPAEPCVGLLNTSCNDEFVRFYAFSCRGSADNQAVGRLRLGNRPGVVDVRVFRDGGQVMQAHYDVHYADEWWPNGRACGLRCGSATVDLVVPTCDPKPMPIDRAKLQALRPAGFLSTWAGGFSAESIATTRQVLESAIDRLIALSDGSTHQERVRVLRNAVAALNRVDDGSVCSIGRQDLCDFLFSLGIAAGLHAATVDHALAAHER